MTLRHQLGRQPLQTHAPDQLAAVVGHEIGHAFDDQGVFEHGVAGDGEIDERAFGRFADGVPADRADDVRRVAGCNLNGQAIATAWPPLSRTMPFGLPVVPEV